MLHTGGDWNLLTCTHRNTSPKVWEGKRFKGYSIILHTAASEVSSDPGVAPTAPVAGVSVTTVSSGPVVLNELNIQSTAGVKRSSRSSTKREESKRKRFGYMSPFVPQATAHQG